jgi:hypothetical protein
MEQLCGMGIGQKNIVLKGIQSSCETSKLFLQCKNNQYYMVICGVGIDHGIFINAFSDYDEWAKVEEIGRTFKIRNLPQQARHQLEA